MSKTKKSSKKHGGSIALGAKINLQKIEKESLFKGEKGIYLDVVIYVNKEPDEYGNSVKITYRNSEDELIYIGNGIKLGQAGGSINDDDLPF